MPRVTWSRTARAELEAIEDYLDGIDPRVALRVVSAIRDGVVRLTGFPESGQRLNDHGPLRSVQTSRTPYRLIYRVVTGGVEIASIRHARQNWLA